MAAHGITARSSRPATWTQCRQRGGNAALGSLVQVDLGATDDLTAAFDGRTPGAVSSPGTQATASGPYATVIPAAAGLARGRVGVVVGRAVSDDQLGTYELGEVGDGNVAPVEVEALVLVSAAATSGAVLGITTSGGSAVLAAGVAGGAWATLLEDATTGSGAVLRRVLLASDGVADGTVQAGDIATSALGRCRYAAFSGLGAASTAGAFGTITWALSAGNNFRLRAVCASAVAPSLACRIIGRVAANGPALTINNNGAIQLQANGVMVAETVAGIYKYDGLNHDVWVDITNTTAQFYYDGGLVGSGSFASQAWSNSSLGYYIGAHFTSSAQRWPGSIQLVELLDNTTPLNSIRLLMDEPSGNYANTYPGSTAAASATRNGYVSTVPVLSLDGRGMPWQPAAMSCLHFGRAAAISAGLYLPPSGIGANVANGIVIPFPARIAAVTVRPIDGAAATLTVSIDVDGSSATTLALSAADSVTSYPNIAVTAGQRIAASCSAFTSGGSSGLTVAVWLLHNSVAG